MGPRRTRRPGMILPSAAVMGLVMLGLAGVYLSSMRHQDTRGRRYAGHTAGRHLARGAVEYVRHLVRDASDPQAPGEATVEPGRSFRDLARHPAGALPAAVRALRKRGAILGPRDDRDLLDRLFGPGARDPLDALEAGLPGAALRIELDFSAARFPGAPDWLADSVMKTFVTSVAAEVVCGGAREAARGDETSVVYPLTPPVLGRFTADTGLVWHDPSGGPTEDPLDPARPDVPLFEGSSGIQAPDMLAARFADQGWVYPRTYVLQAGGGVGGQHGLLWTPRDGRSPSPKAGLLTRQPAGRTTSVPHPTEPFVSQLPLVAGVVQGATDPDPAANLPPGAELRTRGGISSTYPAPLAGSAARLTAHPAMGTSLDPSPTFAPGSRAWVFASSAMTVDRDQRSNDETDQRDAVGVDLPRWEGLVYELTPTPADPDALRQAFDAVARGEAPGMLPGPDPARPFVPNRNVMADTDDDGLPDTPVESEILRHAAVPIDPAAWTVAQRFDSAQEYAGLASRIVEFPLNYCLSLGQTEPKESQALLQAMAWMPGDLAKLAAWDEPFRLLEHRDPLHLAGTEDDRLHYDRRVDEDGEARVRRAKPSSGAGAVDPGDLPPPDLARDISEVEGFVSSRWMPTLEVWGQEDLTKYFPDGDLGGYRVLVGAAVKDEPAYVKLAGDVYRAGLLSSEIVELVGPVPAQGPDRLLEVMAPYLYVAAGGGEKRVALYGGIRPVQDKDDARPQLVRIEGGAYTNTSLIAPASVATEARLRAKLQEIEGRYRPTMLGTRWDPDRDPVGRERHTAYRVAWAGH